MAVFEREYNGVLFRYDAETGQFCKSYAKRFKFKDDAIAYRKQLEVQFAHLTQIPKELN